MQVRIGFIGQRADLAVEVASLAMRADAVVVPLGWDSTSPAGPGTAASDVDVVLVDVETGAEQPTQVSAALDVNAVICRAGEVDRAASLADRLGSAHVVELPAGAAWLEGHLTPPADSGLLGVLGAVGGVGATTAAIACAVAAGRGSLLVDTDPHSCGLDLPLGIAQGVGARWGQIPEASAPLDADSLRSALPEVAGCSVVTGPVTNGGPGWGSGPSTGQCAGVLGVGRAQFRRTVVDIGRARDPLGLLGPGDAVALVVPATLAGVVAARSALRCLPAGRVVLLVRPSPWLATRDVAEHVGVDDVVVVPHLRRAAELCDCGDLLSGRTGRGLRALGEQVWQRLP